MEISVKLQKFEGPMDLLLHLIEKNKIDIMDIPIAEITDQYFEYIGQMQEEDMDTMSDFLVMAATLLDIKAKMLLPPEKDEEGEDIDPRSELVEQLLEYKMYKYMSSRLRGREEEASEHFYREKNLPKEVRSYREPVDIEKLMEDVTLARLSAIFRDVMRRQEDRVDPIRGSFGQIQKEEVDSGAVMQDVEKRIMKRRKCTFRSLLTRKSGKMYVVVTFLTILELMKMGKVNAIQDETFGEIVIQARDKSEWNTQYADMQPEDFD